MDADMAVTLINDELLLNGQAPIYPTVEQSLRSFAALKAYATQTGRPLEVAVKDLVRFQTQTIQLEQLRRQS